MQEYIWIFECKLCFYKSYKIINNAYQFANLPLAGWSISLRLYIGWTFQLTHSNTHRIFSYFESRFAPPTVLNRRIFITTCFSWPWFLFYCRYCRQHTTFARSLHSIIIFCTCCYCMNRDCAQSKSVIVIFSHISHHTFTLRHSPLIIPQGQKWSWKSKRMKRMILKGLQKRGRIRAPQCRADFWRRLKRIRSIRTPQFREFFDEAYRGEEE